MPPQAQERRAPRSQYALSQSPTKIIVQPTEEHQQAYNEIRQTHENQERQRLQAHLASQRNLLPPPTAPSTSAAHSPTTEPVTPSAQDPTAQDPTAQNTDQPRRRRGRRKGPLQADTRWITAVKRKLKLTCPYHRAKKTTCNCHDFTKLEEGYQAFLQRRSASGATSQASNNVSPITPLERTLPSPLEGAFNRDMIGVGAAMDQEPPSNDLDILQSAVDDEENVVRSDVQLIVSGFDADTVRLVDTAMLQAPGQTYHPGNDMGTPSPSPSPSPRIYTPDDYLEIGSQNQYFPNRWHCRYKGDVDSLSEVSSHSQDCAWSGSIHELNHHFSREHHPFLAASPSFWHVCTSCGAKVQPQDDLGPPLSPLQCGTPSCFAPTFERWYFGSTRTESVAESLPGLTQSSESETGFSCYLSLDGQDLSQLGGRGSGGAFNYRSGSNNWYENPGSYSAKWKASSDLPNQPSGCDCYPRDRVPPFAREDGTVRHSSDSRAQIRCHARPAKCSPRRCPIRLLSYVKLSVSHLLPVLLPLLVTAIIRESGCLFDSSPSSTRTFWLDEFDWCSLALLCLGFLATWAFKEQRARPPSADQSDNRTRGRRFSRTAVPLIIFRSGVVWAA